MFDISLVSFLSISSLTTESSVLYLYIPFDILFFLQLTDNSITIAHNPLLPIFIAYSTPWWLLSIALVSSSIHQRYHRAEVTGTHNDTIYFAVTSSWWRYQMETFFRATGHWCGEFTGPSEFPTQRPVTRNCDVFFDLRLNKRLSKQSWGWWFETLFRPWWRQCNVWNPTNLETIINS